MPRGQVSRHRSQLDIPSGADHLDTGQAIEPRSEPSRNPGRAEDQPGNAGIACGEELSIAAQLTRGGDGHLRWARWQATAHAIGSPSRTPYKQPRVVPADSVSADQDRITGRALCIHAVKVGIIRQ
jgi:hypothetical protein